MSQPTFVFAGDQTKLQAAPNFDSSTDLTQPSWRQSIFSYFGLSGSGSVGGSLTPGGSSSGSSSSQDNSSSSSDSSSSSSGSQQDSSSSK